MKKFYLTVMSWPRTFLLSIRRFECESDNKFASFGIDIVGRRIYTIQIKILKLEKSFRIRLITLLETPFGQTIIKPFFIPDKTKLLSAI
jgi:hypothetical protein